MGLLNNILQGKTSETVKAITGVIDGVVTSDKEKMQLKNKLTEIVSEKLTELAQAQKEVLIAEVSGNQLQRNWRPIVMLAFTFIVIYSKFIAPAFGLPNTELEPYFWNLLEIGLGGYVIGRSVEKVADKVTQNIDISFIKRKKRQL